MIKVLFVCMGNICRSPTAEGVFRHHVQQKDLEKQFFIDSAGTHSYHVGSRPDKRSQQAAGLRGVDISRLRARRVTDKDYEFFDYILAMDNANYRDLADSAPGQYQHKISLFLSYAQDKKETEVPDPYYGGLKGFEHVLDLVSAASQGLLEELIDKHGVSVEGALDTR